MRLENLHVDDIRSSLIAKQYSAVELVTAYLKRVHDVNGSLNAFLTVMADEALEQARALDSRISSGENAGPLLGTVIAVKDNILMKGVRTTAGSKILDTYKGAYDATVVDRLRSAGALFIGKTNLDEFGMGASTENSAYGATKNPWDPSRVAGGSSGGSAAAIATAMSCAALGTDTGGSIRQPASLCGVVGMRPTYGRVSRNGMIALSSSLDQIGPVTKTVGDAAAVFLAMAGRDSLDVTTVEKQLFIPQEILGDITGMRIGVPKEYFIEGMDPEVEKTVRKALKQLEKLGAKIQEVHMPLTPYSLAVYYITVVSEASSNLARYDGVRYGSKLPRSSTFREAYRRLRGDELGEEVKRRIILGTFSLSQGYFDRYYLQAQKVRARIKHEFTKVFDTVDCLVAPTSPTVAFALGEKFSDPLTMYLSDIFTTPASIADAPGISVPCGFVRGLPVGLQFMTAPFDEKTLFKVAHAYEQATDWHTRMAPLA